MHCRVKCRVRVLRVRVRVKTIPTRLHSSEYLRGRPSHEEPLRTEVSKHAGMNPYLRHVIINLNPVCKLNTVAVMKTTHLRQRLEQRSASEARWTNHHQRFGRLP